MNRRPDKIVMATGNPGKLREIARLLERLGIEVVAQSEFGVSDADETGTTFAENSLIKAQHAADATGLPALADDSGLAVDALDGAPGVFSARYAGDAGDEANNDKLLAALEGVTELRAGMIIGPGSAAWEVIPPRAVRIPLATFMPRKSSGEVSVRTRTTSLPASTHSSASSAKKTTSSWHLSM